MIFFLFNMGPYQQNNPYTWICMFSTPVYKTETCINDYVDIRD